MDQMPYLEEAQGEEAQIVSPSPRGRPSLYKPEYAKQAYKLCQMGATDIELAKFFEVSPETIYQWANVNEDFAESKKVGKAACDNRVERSLYQKAIGFTREAEKVVIIDDVPVKVRYEEYVPPSDTAMIFWLKNRRRHEWRDRHEIEHGRVGEFDKMSDRELLEFIEVEAREIGISPETLQLPPVKKSRRKSSD